MPMKPAAPESIAPIRKPIAASQPSGGRDEDEDRQDDRDDRDRRVLALRNAIAPSWIAAAISFIRSLPAGCAEHPEGEDDAVEDREGAADQPGHNRCLCRHLQSL